MVKKITQRTQMDRFKRQRIIRRAIEALPTTFRPSTNWASRQRRKILPTQLQSSSFSRQWKKFILACHIWLSGKCIGDRDGESTTKEQQTSGIEWQHPPWMTESARIHDKRATKITAFIFGSSLSFFFFFGITTIIMHEPLHRSFSIFKRSRSSNGVYKSPPRKWWS